MLFRQGDELMYRCGVISPSGKASVLCCNDISKLEDKTQELATEYDYMIMPITEVEGECESEEIDWYYD